MTTKRLRADLARILKLDDKAGLKWQLLVPKGRRWDPRYDWMEFDAAFLQSLHNNFEKLAARYKGPDGFGLRVDYFHVEEGEDVPLEQALAAGWIEATEVREDGLWVGIKWTADTAELIKADKLRFISAEMTDQWFDTHTGERQGPTLIGAAVTNRPAMKDLPRIAASEAPPEAAPAAATEGAKHMDKKLLCASLGLPETATDQEIQARIVKLKEAEAKAGEATGAAVKLTEVQALTSKLSEELKATTTKLSDAQKQVDQLLGEKKERDATEFTQALVKEGKIVPAMFEDVKKLALSDLNAAKATFAKAAPVVSFTEQGIPGDTGAQDKVKAAQAKLDTRVGELRKNDPKLKYSEATSIALSEPEMRDVNAILFTETTAGEKKKSPAA